jgi:hypothetical protein
MTTENLKLEGKVIDLNDLPKNVHDRLEYIEFMLRFRGWFSRVDLTERFGLGEAAATRDIRLYKDFADSNMVLNQSTKKYEIAQDNFTPIFDMRVQTALSKLRNAKICEALGMSDHGGVLCTPRLTNPNIDVLSKITRAIASNSILETKYRSIKNGYSDKYLIPHALFDNGIHWYMRAFDKSKNEFRSYALTRIESVRLVPDQPAVNSVKVMDSEWHRMVKLELVPHPNKKNVPEPETVEHDFKMVDGCLKLSARSTVVGYWLKNWSVDCTEDHSLQGYEYQLWLRNHNTLYDVESRVIAPGLSEYSHD